MIIVNLSGGLGNQMFQYALGRVLAETNNDNLKLDTSSFDLFNPVDTLRSFELDIFQAETLIASRSEVMRLSDPNPLICTLNRILRMGVNPYPKGYIRENNSHVFQNNIFKNKGDMFLVGFWQSEKYFKSYSELIRKEFSFRKKPNSRNRLLLKDINNSESVSIHVRRGDYVTNSNANKFHGTCSIDYYQKAIAQISTKCKNPKYYIFSDDISWCKKNLKIRSSKLYVDHNKGENSWEDMRLMSMCKHNIIANSSFSWWAAWLNNNPNKTVIAPKNWFRNKSINTEDLIPTTWIKL